MDTAVGQCFLFIIKMFYYKKGMFRMTMMYKKVEGIILKELDDKRTKRHIFFVVAYLLGCVLMFIAVFSLIGWQLVSL